jgi:hypothetical protein
MIGRASAEPLPVHLSEDLRPALTRVGAAISSYFRDCALALTSRDKAVRLAPPQEELNACASQLALFREHNLAHLSASQLEQLFALSFVLEQLQRNISDLERCVLEWAISPGHAANNRTK